MKANLRWDVALRFVGSNAQGHETIFDTTRTGGGLDSAASPMDIVLEAAAACTAMDIVTILQKQRRTITILTIELEGQRAEKPPKVFTKITMNIRLASPDATEQELTRAIELSHSTYCSVSIMLARSGCEIVWRAELAKPSAIERSVIVLGGTA